jgi:hypothetical protein
VPQHKVEEAVWERLVALLQLLIRRGAPLEARCKEGYTAAALAVKLGINCALVVLHGECLL